MDTHAYLRENFKWRANMVPPHREYLMKELSTPHIVNIIKNVDHLNDRQIFDFLLELEGRRRGIYEDIEEYSDAERR